MDLEVVLDRSLLSRDCFARLPPRLSRSIHESFLTLRLLRGDGGRLFVGWSGGLSRENGTLEIPLQLGECLGLKHGERVTVEAVPSPPVAERVIVTSSREDWDVVQLNAGLLEDIILSQIRVLSPGMRFPVSLSNGSRVVLAVTDTQIDPSSAEKDFCLLSAGSEIAVAPPEGSGRRNASTDRKRQAFFKGRVLPAEDCNPCCVLLHEDDAREFNFEECDVVLLTCTNSVTGRKQLATRKHAVLRVSTSIPREHVAIHDRLREQLQAPALSAIHVELVDTSAAKAATSVQVYCGADDDAELWPPETSDLENAVEEWAKELLGGDTHRSVELPHMVPIALSLPQKTVFGYAGFNGENFEIDRPSQHCSKDEKATPEKFDEPFEDTEEIAIENKNKKTASVKVHTGHDRELYRFTPADLENRTISIQVRSLPWRHARVPYGDFGWRQGPQPSDLTGRSSRKAFDAVVHALQPVYAYHLHRLDRKGLPPPLAVVNLSAPRGCGKSVTAACVARYLREQHPATARTVWIRCRAHAGEALYASSRRLKLAAAVAYRCRPALVVLDDFDEIADCSTGDPTEDPSKTDKGSLVTSALLDALQAMNCGANGIGRFRESSAGGGLLSPIPAALAQGGECDYLLFLGILITSTAVSSLDKQLTSPRFMTESTVIEPPDEDARAEMLALFLRRVDPSVISLPPSTLEALEEALYECARDAQGFTPTDLLRLSRRIVTDKTSGNLDPTCVASAMEGFLPASVLGSKASSGLAKSSKFEDIGGLEEAKAAIREAVEYPVRYSKLFAKAPLRVQTGCLLFGPSGCGKTFLAGASAAEFGLRIIDVKGPELLNKYIGSSEAAVRDAFDRASSARPCILFFDEFESIAPKRGGDTTGVSDRIVNTLLTAMDGVEKLEGVFVIAATSRPDLVDPALLRPGRLDRWIPVDMPTLEDRAKILQVACRGLKMAPDVDLDSMAQKTEGFTGADLQGLVYSAQLAGVHEKFGDEPDQSEQDTPVLEMRHLVDGLSSSRPSNSPEEVLRYRKRMSRFYSGEGSNVDLSGPKAQRVAMK